MAPSATALEGALRRVVKNVYESGNMEELTVKRVRTGAEEELGLEEGFFKTDEEWKERSKAFISGEVEALEKNGEPSSQVDSPQKPKQIPNTMDKKEQKKAKGVKRKSTDAGKSRKWRKTDSEEENLSATEEEGHSSPKDDIQGSSSKQPTPPVVDIERDSKKSSDPKPETDSAKPEQSESDMSVLDDEPPKRKKKSKGQNRTSTSSGRGKENKHPGTEKPKNKSSSKEPADPDQEEIKRLQGWLVKCGIRKMWWKELQPFESSKAKIAHLKEMLVDIGMVGRYSQEKASQIREERELKADLEAVQEGAKIWGKDDEDVVDGGARPKRQLAKGLQGLDFLNDDDGEETD